MKTVSLHRPPAGNPRLESLTDGFRRHGWNVEWVDRTDKPGIAARSSLFIRTGMHWRDEPAAAAMGIHDVPTWVTDLGYLKRSPRNGQDGYYQLGIGKIGWTPPSAPPDRFDALEIEVPDVESPPGAPWLICGQVGNDSQHQRSASELTDWIGQAITWLELTPCRWRPHPLGARLARPPKNIHSVCRTPDLQTALRASRGILTYNSTAGIDAMLAGRIALSHQTAWWHAAGKTADRQARLDFLARVAYAQWTLPEFADGSAIDYLLAHTHIA